MMTTSSYSYQASVCSQRATPCETQNVTMRSRLLKGALRCGIVITLSIVPFNRAAAQNGVAVIGPTPTSTPYGCTTAGTSGNIQQAISDAINQPVGSGITQSVVDASNCTTLNITSEIYVGVADPNAPLKERIKFIVPANGTWTANFSDTSKYALKWGNGAMIYGGTGSGLGQPFIVTTASGTTLKAVCGNDPTYATYFHVEGFTCNAGAGSTIIDAVIAIEGVLTPVITGPADTSYLGHVTGTVTPPATVPRVVLVYGACCSSTYEDISAGASGNAGTTSCVFGNGGQGEKNIGIHASRFSCTGPGSHQNAVLIQQTGGTSNLALGNSFRDFYMEWNSTGQASTDLTTPFVAVTETTGTFPPADLLDGFRAGGDAAGSTRYMVDIGAGSRVNISNLGLGFVSNRAINDHVNNVMLVGTVNETIAGYDMTPRFLAATTVSSLPPASSNAGAMFRVTDSANSGEGHACVGGGTITALAFSNGSIWKCF